MRIGQRVVILSIILGWSYDRARTHSSRRWRKHYIRTPGATSHCNPGGMTNVPVPFQNGYKNQSSFTWGERITFWFILSAFLCALQWAHSHTSNTLELNFPERSSNALQNQISKRKLHNFNYDRFEWTKQIQTSLLHITYATRFMREYIVCIPWFTKFAVYNSKIYTFFINKSQVESKIMNLLCRYVLRLELINAMTFWLQNCTSGNITTTKRSTKFYDLRISFLSYTVPKLDRS